VRLAFDGIFSVTPLRAAWILGAVASVTASIYALWAIFERRFLDTSPPGFTALIVAITLVAGIRLLSLGLIGEYLGRVYDETKSRPQYIITEVVCTTTRTTSRPCR
jgi:polyisoprenyl-phosphate glycosyltransferase